MDTQKLQLELLAAHYLKNQATYLGPSGPNSVRFLKLSMWAILLKSTDYACLHLEMYLSYLLNYDLCKDSES